MDRPQMQGAGRAAITPASAVVLVLGALAIVGTLFVVVKFFRTFR